jgi:hypothetical protein
VSYELFHNGHPQGQIATITGWSNFTGDIDVLGDSAPKLVRRFITRGWVDDPVAFGEQLNELLESGHLSSESADVVKGLMERLPENGVVSIANE